jgi:hypothetical protein
MGCDRQKPITYLLWDSNNTARSCRVTSLVTCVFLKQRVFYVRTTCSVAGVRSCRTPADYNVRLFVTVCVQRTGFSLNDRGMTVSCAKAPNWFFSPPCLIFRAYGNPVYSGEGGGG